MAKKKKKAAPIKKTSSSRVSEAARHDPEWDVLQERFETMGTDWSRLIDIVK